jgi:hypothetical protein
MVVTARAMIAGLILLGAVSPAHAARVRRDPGDEIFGQAVAATGLPAIPGAAEFNRLSRPIPLHFGFAQASESVAAGGLAVDPPAAALAPRAFPPADDPVLILDVPRSTGWMPLVGGLVLVAYRIRRAKRRFRFRSAV